MSGGELYGCEGVDRRTLLPIAASQDRYKAAYDRDTPPLPMKARYPTIPLKAMPRPLPNVCKDGPLHTRPGPLPQRHVVSSQDRTTPVPLRRCRRSASLPSSSLTSSDRLCHAPPSPPKAIKPAKERYLPSPRSHSHSQSQRPVSSPGAGETTLSAAHRGGGLPALAAVASDTRSLANTPPTPHAPCQHPEHLELVDELRTRAETAEARARCLEVLLSRAVIDLTKAQERQKSASAVSSDVKTTSLGTKRQRPDGDDPSTAEAMLGTNRRSKRGRFAATNVRSDAVAQRLRPAIAANAHAFLAANTTFERQSPSAEQRGMAQVERTYSAVLSRRDNGVGVGNSRGAIAPAVVNSIPLEADT